MKKVLAISGGVDSMVLLYMFRNDPDVVVAHFDHGTRPSSAEDAKFVEAAAKKYGLPFYLGRAKLGAKVSEEQARISRYEYLEKVAKGLDGEIYTAHHADDLIESIAINLVRGTGWRGMTPFGNVLVKRPFLDTTLLSSEFLNEFINLQRELTGGAPDDEEGSDLVVVDKIAILQSAANHSLHFRQDPTNSDGQYLRNRLREKLKFLDNSKKIEFVKLYHETNNLRDEIDGIIADLLPANGIYFRHWFSRLDDDVAMEILRGALKKAGLSATRPQMLDFLKAIREYNPAKQFNLPNDRLIKFSKHLFVLK